MYCQELATALNLALECGNIQRRYTPDVLTIEKKEDASPVTEIDRQCESLLRSRLLKRFPSDGFLGEETGTVDGSSGRRWIIDPIDGTRPFIRGIPTYSTLLALEDGNEPVLGVIHLPALSITCWANTGEGAFCNGTPIHVSKTAQLSETIGSALGFVEHPATDSRERLLSTMRLWNYNYGFMDAYSYVCLAGGKIDCCISLLDKPWDCAAAACIISEAGGTWTDIQGNSSIYNGSFLASNGLLHHLLLQLLSD
jgi:histidinol-phosphatase